jgi:hypothetical protein
LVDSVRFAAAGTIARRSDDGTVGAGLSDGVGGADGVTVSWSPSSAIVCATVNLTSALLETSPLTPMVGSPLI